MSRELCVRCFRSKRDCYCAGTRPFRPELDLVLLQHPRERKKSVGTARIVRVCVETAILRVGIEFDSDPVVRGIIADTSRLCVVLYPGANSRNLSLETSESLRASLPFGKRLTVFVIDGTWFMAKQMMRDSHCLRELPRVCFTPERQSDYRFRKQPRPEYVSTLEAVLKILDLYDPATDSSELSRVFKGLVEKQLSYTAV